MHTTRLTIVLLLVSIGTAMAQPPDSREFPVERDGRMMTAIVADNGDTLYLSNLEEMTVTRMTRRLNREERKHYRRYRYFAHDVYPIAVNAIKLYREIERDTKDMKKRKRKKYLRRKHKALKKEFKTQLSKLSKTRGKILIKMIERQLDMPFYDLVKDMRGGMTAFYWQNLGRMYGFNLKQGYDPDDDPILEMILSDLELE